MPLFFLNDKITKTQVGRGTAGKNTPVWFLGNNRVFLEPKEFYVTQNTLRVEIPSYVSLINFDVVGSQGCGAGGFGGRVTGQLKVAGGGISFSRLVTVLKETFPLRNITQPIFGRCRAI